jgi:predicted flap endonuclease-1-like 5' DNA nuclease
VAVSVDAASPGQRFNTADSTGAGNAAYVEPEAWPPVEPPAEPSGTNPATEAPTDSSATTEASTPETATPETATPETATPEAATPDTATPDTATPGTAAPKTATLKTATLRTAAPTTATVETAAPDAATAPASTATSARAKATRSKATSAKATSTKATSTKPAESTGESAAESVGDSVAVSAPAASEAAPEDLARIEGIGPKIAAALVAAGIRTFAELAETDEATIRDAISAAGIRFAPSIVTWSEQARLLADGNEDEFAVLTARLIAGRRANDDLQRIEGIGPQMEAALQTAGIRTYRALADSDDTTLRAAITNNGLKFAPSIVTWARQARLLADGDEEGFTDLTRRLVAGRDEGRA